jgi:hypothetical protein
MIAAERAFANRDVFLPGWFPVCASRELTTTRRAIELGPVRAELWRDVDGAARGTFPVTEEHGLVFTYPATSHAPLAFPAMPDGDDARNFRALVLPSSNVNAHHHLTTANGLDAVHFEALHDLDSLTPWHHTVDADTFSVHLHLHHRHRNRALHALCGELRARFSAYGPTVAWVTALEPVRMHALFCTRPEPGGGSSSRAVLFFPRGLGRTLTSMRVVTFLFSLLRQDEQMLDALRDFRPAYVETDAPLRDYDALLQRWPRA